MSLHAICYAPGKQADTTHRVKSLKHGKPNCLHLSMESDPQGKPIGKWVKEVGKSECHPVMGWIRVQTLPDTKVGRLPTGVESRETFGRSNLYGEDRQWNLSIDGRKSNSDLWNSINWKKVKQIVNRLQTRIVKAVKAKEKRSKEPPAGRLTALYQCLSPVR